MDKGLVIASGIQAVLMPWTAPGNIEFIVKEIRKEKKQKNETSKIHWALNETKKYPMGFYYEGRA